MMMRKLFYAAIFVLAGITMGVWFYYYQSKQHSIDTTATKLQQLVDKKFKQLSTYFDQYQAHLRELVQQITQLPAAQSTDQLPFDLAAFTELLQKQSSPQLCLITMDGKVQFSTISGITPDINVKEEPYQHTSLGKFFELSKILLAPSISDLTFYPTIDHMVLFAGIPCIYNNTFVGILIATIPFEQLIHTTKKFDVFSHGQWIFTQSVEDSIGILQEQNGVVQYKTIPRVNELPSSIVLQSVSGTMETGLATDLNQNTIVAASHYEPHVEWGIAAFINIKQVLQPLIVVKIIAWILTIMSALALMYLIYRAYYYLFVIRPTTTSGIPLWFSIILHIALSAACLVTIILLYYVISLAKTTYAEAKTKNHIQLQNAVLQLNHQLFKVEFVGESLADELTHKKLSHDALDKRINQLLTENPHISSITIAYEPQNNQKLTAPTWVRHKGTITQENLAQYFDYTVSHPTQQPETSWYHQAIDKKTTWSLPYKDPFGTRTVITFAVPFYYENSNKVGGVIAMTYPLFVIQDTINLFLSNFSGKMLMVAADGSIIYHSSLETMAQDLQDPGVAKTIKIATETYQGFVEYYNKQKHTMWAWHQTMGLTQWRIIILLEKSSVPLPALTVRHSAILLLSSILFFIVLLVFIVFYLYAHSLAAFRITAVVSSLCFTLGTLAIWYGSRLPIFSADPQETSINTVSKLNKFIDFERYKASQIAQQPALLVPTSFKIYSIELSDKDTIHITAHARQTYPLTHPPLTYGIRFPQAVAARFSKTYENIKENQQTIGWDINCDLFQKIDHSKYPFDTTYLELIMQSKETRVPLLLIPDLTEPPMAKNTRIGNFTLESTFYTYVPNIYAFTENTPPALNLSLKLERNLLNPLISYLIPILIIFLALFLLSLYLQQMHQRKKEIEFAYQLETGLTITATYSGLFFSIVLIHSSLRSTFAISTVLYLEYFFFCAYATVLFLQTIAMSESIAERLSHKNLIKYLYWPLQTCIWFIITTIIFYNP